MAEQWRGHARKVRRGKQGLVEQGFETPPWGNRMKSPPFMALAIAANCRGRQSPHRPRPESWG